MRSAFLAAALSLGLSGQSMAQDTAQALCAASWQVLAPAFGRGKAGIGLDARPQVVDGWCVTNALTPAWGGGGLRIEIARLYWRGEGLEAYLADGTWPARLDLRAEGVVLRRADTRTGAPLRLDAVMALTWDAATGTLRLDGPDLDLPGDNAISVDAQITRITPVSPARALAALSAGSLEFLTVTAASDGMLARHLGAGEGNPAGLQTRALDRVAQIPDVLIDTASRDALRALARALPRPRGTVEIGAEAEKGYALGRLWNFAGPRPPRDSAGVAKVLKGLRFTASFDPDAAP